MEKVGKFNKKCERNQGFSLIELIIVIAILVILTGLLAPQFMKYIEKSRKAVCDNNIDVILSEFQIAQIENYDVEINPKYIKNFLAPYQNKCPSKGEYVGEAKDDQFIVKCTFHGGGKSGSSDPSIIIAETLYKKMQDFAGVDQKEIEKIKQKLKDAGLGDRLDNNNLTRYLLQEQGGSWPSLDPELLKKYGITTEYYVMPYLNSFNKSGLDKTDKVEDVIIFATGNDKNIGNFYTGLIYNPNDEMWYKGKGGISVANKTWSEVWQEMQDKKWAPLK